MYRTLAAAHILLVLTVGATRAQDPPADGATALAKASQNPIGDLVSLPFQFNFNSGGGMGGNTLFNLNFQPVLPLPMGSRWTLIARTIVPYVSLPTSRGGRRTGVGDIQQQYYWTLAHPGEAIWGAGPVLSFPTATLDDVATSDWAAGPAFVVVRNSGAFLAGTLINQLWTYAGDRENQKINQLTIQPFVNYNMRDGWALTFSPILTANWSGDTGEEWTIPLGGGFSKVTTVGSQPISVGAQYYNNIVRPTAAGANLLRLQVNLLYPAAPLTPSRAALGSVSASPR